MILLLIINQGTYPLQPSLELLIDKHQGSKCATHVTVTSGDDLVNR
jgi:hypothetical protein